MSYVALFFAFVTVVATISACYFFAQQGNWGLFSMSIAVFAGIFYLTSLYVVTR